MLTDTVSKISSAKDARLNALKAIDARLESALHELGAIKADLSQCLTAISEETCRQKEETENPLNTLNASLIDLQAGAGPVTAEEDAATGLPLRAAAQRSLTASHVRGQRLFAMPIILVGLQSIYDRHGSKGGDQILLQICQVIDQVIETRYELFRWGQVELLAVLDRPGSKEEVQRQLGKLAYTRLDLSLEMHGASVCTVDLSSKVDSILEFPTSMELIESISDYFSDFAK